VVYEVWRGPNCEVGPTEGILPLSEFSMEIYTAVAFLVSMVGLSMDSKAVIDQLQQVNQCTKDKIRYHIVGGTKKPVCPA